MLVYLHLWWCSANHVFKRRFFDDKLGNAVSKCSLRPGFSPFQWRRFIRLLVPFSYLSLILPDLDYHLLVDARSAFKAHPVSFPFSSLSSVFIVMSELNWQTCASTPAFVIPNYSETHRTPSLQVRNAHPCSACSHMHKRISLCVNFDGAAFDLWVLLVQHLSAILYSTMWMVYKNRSRRMQQVCTTKKQKTSI